MVVKNAYSGIQPKFIPKFCHFVTLWKWLVFLSFNFVYYRDMLVLSFALDKVIHVKCLTHNKLSKNGVNIIFQLQIEINTVFSFELSIQPF